MSLLPGRNEITRSPFLIKGNFATTAFLERFLGKIASNVLVNPSISSPSIVKPCKNIKLWVFWDVDSEKLKACKNSDDRESMRCCDNCVRQLHAGEEEIAFQLEVEAKDDSGVEEEIDCDINKKKDDVKNADNNWYHFNDRNVSKISENVIRSPKAYCFFFRKKK